jgi:poly(3-hydroxybutyrate) depolymerase
LQHFFVRKKKVEYFSKMHTVGVVIALLSVTSLVDAFVSRTNITVSGASSGAAMATQLHFAYSKDISGVGVLAGPPYDCAGALLTAAECLSGPVTSISVPDIEKRIKKFETEGVIDSTSNMVGDPVYIFSGKYDPVVLQPIAKLNGILYESFNTNIKTNYDLPSSHGLPTVNFGDPCPILNTKYFLNKW